MTRHGLAVDDVLGEAILVDTLGRKNREGARVDLFSPIRNDDDDYLLPRVFAPHLAPVSRAQVLDILLYTVHCPCVCRASPSGQQVSSRVHRPIWRRRKHFDVKLQLQWDNLQRFSSSLYMAAGRSPQGSWRGGSVRLVSRPVASLFMLSFRARPTHDDHQFNLSGRLHELLSQSVVLIYKVVRVAGGGGVPQPRELLVVPQRASLEQFRRNRYVEHQVSSVQ